MRIAQVSPLYESVPPRLYGGTERIVSYLTEELVRRGEDVTLFASGDSTTAATLHSTTARALRLDPRVIDPVAHHVAQVHRVIARAGDFDVIHNHMDYLAFSIALCTRTPVVTTLHGRLDIPDLFPLFAINSQVPVISISDAQREPLPHARWVGTVHHGIPADLCVPGDGSGGYLAFLGRISPEKRVDSAIRIAEAAEVPLKIAAKIDRADVGYFESVVRPMLRSSLVEYIGEINDREKPEFLGAARALLFPIDWPEPFGLAMIESLGCGTPVIARRRGSVTEVIDEGVTGFVCNDEPTMVAAVGRLDEIDRRSCRAVFDQRFTAARMADDYLRIYRALIETRRGDGTHTGGATL